MNFTDEQAPLTRVELTADRMDRWSAGLARGESTEVYPKPSQQQLQELQNVRNLSKELQDNLHELENSVRNPEKENEAMTPTAPILDYSEDHEFISANQMEGCYAEEDMADAKEEEKKRLMKGNAPRTEIQRFYKDQCVFLTGGTGFLGKVFIEKMLRSCGDVDSIYLLVRGKKGKDAVARIHEMLDQFLFHRAHEVNPKGIHKVIPIVGDMEQPGLGISDEDRKMLTSKVTIIINAAATVKFDEKLSVAAGINVVGTREVLRLAKECRQLRAVTHISTAFSNTPHRYIEEKFYDPPMSAETLEAVANIDEKILEGILPTLLDKYPNTYCFTKAIAEDTVRRYGEGLPICILRPSIVISTYEEPVRGWTDSVYGPTGLVIGIGTGVLRTMYMDQSKVADMVPVDLAVNAIIASAWHTANNYKENQTSHIPIYNFVSGAQNPITWGEFIERNREKGIKVPTTKAVWYYGLNPTNSYLIFKFYDFFLHYLPALLIDAVCFLTGSKRSMLKFYRKVSKLATILFYFSTQEWRFADDNTRAAWRALSRQDRTLFPFNIADMSWDYMTDTFLVGLRVYLLKDDMSTLPEATKKWKRLYYLHQCLKVITVVVVLSLSYALFNGLYKLIMH